MCFLDAISNISTILLSRSAENPSSPLSSECGRLCSNYWVYTDTDWAVLCVGLDREQTSHIYLTMQI